MPRRALRRAASIPAGPPRVCNYCFVHSDAKRARRAATAQALGAAAPAARVLLPAVLLGHGVQHLPLQLVQRRPAQVPRQVCQAAARAGDDDPRHLAASEEDARQVLGIQCIDAAPFDKVSLSQQQFKDAFRGKALEWHPECNQEARRPKLS
ncbi:Double-strand-break repair protein rad21 [Phytophthora cinnamomi]|uniref:Double-strand-break repair protein rad21 n=1 Tax=Phytophthora cinnamomi TaxID=4785 RepID=UPI00355A600A|nr:Double-strand-break repair protein rad21 [Phytophthora cinnamomi]